MSRRMLAVSLIAAALVGAWGRSADARQEGPGRGRYSDPYFNVYAWPRHAGGNDTFLFFLAAQHRAAQLARAEQQPAGATAGRAAASSHHLMSPGGSAAGGYFGRTAVIAPNAGPAAPSRYNRYGHYFGNR